MSTRGSESPPTLSQHGGSIPPVSADIPASGLTGPSEFFSTAEFDSASHRASPVAPQPGLQVRYETAEDGQVLLVDAHTGEPVVIVDRTATPSATSSHGKRDTVSPPAHSSPTPQGRSTDRTPSSPSYPSFPTTDIGAGAPEQFIPAQDQVITPLTDLLARIPPGALSVDDMNRFHGVRGVLSTSRSHLMASTVMISKQQENLGQTHADIIEFRNYAASRLASLHNEVTGNQSKINRCLMDNIKMLRDMGASDAALTEVISATAAFTTSPSDGLSLPELPRIELHDIAPPQDLWAEMTKLVPPRGPHESESDYEARVHAVWRVKARASAAFQSLPPSPTLRQPPIGPEKTSIRPPESCVQNHGKHPQNQMEDIGGISTAVPYRDVRFGALPNT
ncbi:hypothetical protein DFH09DRAFT_1318304 [Mycena vulgaris]|nr:hypothetical protein DFH09DRAFT_1318304 [Mycena vulgaris]